VSIGKVTDVIE